MKVIRSEDDVISSWEQGIDKPVVSICCITYNHEKYIIDALDGVINQETSFPFELLIHDDASTDNTAKLIKDYAKNYPKIVKPIFQTENQYSKGLKMNQSFNFPRAKGRYIALCEGDDYWVDVKKLQKQYDILEKYKKINLVVHDAVTSDDRGKVVRGSWHGSYFRDKIVSVEEVFIVDGQFAPTASYFFRNKELESLNSYPEAPVGDFLIEVVLGIDGIYAMSDKMSIYRVGIEGSWTNTILKEYTSKINHYNNMLKTLNRMDVLVPKGKRNYILYKKKSVYYSMAIASLNRDKLQSLLYFAKSIDIKNLKFKRLILYFYYVLSSLKGAVMK